MSAPMTEAAKPPPQMAKRQKGFETALATDQVIAAVRATAHGDRPLEAEVRDTGDQFLKHPLVAGPRIQDRDLRDRDHGDVGSRRAHAATLSLHRRVSSKNGSKPSKR